MINPRIETDTSVEGASPCDSHELAEHTLTRNFNGTLSLGSCIAKLHGLTEADGIVTFAHNYIMGPGSASGEMVAIVPWPEVDAGVGFRALAAVLPGERALVLPAQPGLVDYYRNRGILADGAHVYEVPFQKPDGFSQVPGFPYTDVFQLAARSGLKVNDGPVVATFPSPYVSAQIEQIGGVPVQKSNAALSNNKAEFRAAAERYGFRVSDGATISSARELFEAQQLFRNESRVWLKLDRGSGGDLVVPVDGPITLTRIEEAIEGFRSHVRNAFLRSDFGEGALEKYWPESSMLPSGGKLVLEADISRVGRLVANGSNVILVDENGLVSIPYNFVQNVSSKGEYLGGSPWTPSPEQERLLQRQMRAVASYAAEELQLRGIIGVDFFIAETPKGELEVVLIEMNGRPSSNCVAHMLAEKLGVSHWVNAKLTSPTEINTLHELEEALTVGGKNYLMADPQRGAVVPLAMRALWEWDGKGEKRLAYPSHVAEILVTGESQERCEQIIQSLRQAGLKIG